MNNVLEVIGPMDVSRISFILGVKSDFNNLNDKSNYRNFNLNEYTEDYIANIILDYMDAHRELEDVSMTLSCVKGLYRNEYNCPPNGERLYRLTSLYNPIYGQSKEDWYNTIIEYAKELSELFHQASCTIIIENYDEEHPLQFIYIKNKYETRRML